MREKKHNAGTFFSSRWFLLLAFFVAFSGMTAFGRAFYQNYEAEQQKIRLQEEVHNLSAKKLESLEVLKYVRSNAFAEEKARLELNLVKPGEQVAIIPSKTLTVKESRQAESDLLQSAEQSNPAKWYRFFFGGEEKDKTNS